MDKFRRYLLRPLLVMLLLVVALVGVLGFMTWMPGERDGVDERELSAEEAATAERLRDHVEFLASKPRNRDEPEHEQAVLDYLERGLREAGWEPRRLVVETAEGPFHSVAARRAGTVASDELVVLGAHWDTRGPTPGADDNASGCAALLELAAWLSDKDLERSVELIFWANEEPPYFHTAEMGSLQHASNLKAEGEDVVVAISLEMLGYYDTADDSQRYPPVLNLFYPDRGSFIAFVGSMWHRSVVTESVGAFRSGTDFPVVGFAGPESMSGLSLSDHWSFWQNDYPAFMITDTAFFRTPHYHQYSDVPATLDYDRFARVTVAIRSVVRHWALDVER